MLSQLSYIPTLIFFNGGERGIRTLGAVTRSTVFETVPFNQLWHLSAGPIYKDFSVFFYLAEREGFEPSVESPPHTISNRAD